MMKRLLNVREHLAHVQRAIEGFQKYGDVPIVRHDLAQCKLINNAILRKHEKTRVGGNRKDIYVNAHVVERDTQGA